MLQVDLTGIGTGRLEGRAGPDAPWAVIATATASGLTAVAVMPEMRFNATLVGIGAVFNAWLVSN